MFSNFSVSRDYPDLNFPFLNLGFASPCRPARPRTTALLSPRSNGKPEAATAVVVAPDDGNADARNMLSCI